MIVGIDLGTTNSLVAYYTPDGPRIRGRDSIRKNESVS